MTVLLTRLAWRLFLFNNNFFISTMFDNIQLRFFVVHNHILLSHKHVSLVFFLKKLCYCFNNINASIYKHLIKCIQYMKKYTTAFIICIIIIKISNQPTLSYNLCKLLKLYIIIPRKNEGI